MVTLSVRVAKCRLNAVKAVPLTSRIGIYAGTFDPVHAGHVKFALQATENAKLDEIYFLPERKPRNKQGVEHFGHRVAMLNRASRPHPKFSVLELDDVSFTIRRTIPALRKRFPASQLVFLFGSDVIEQLPEWPHSDKLLRDNELVIGIRATEDLESVQKIIDDWPVHPKSVTLLHSSAPEVSSRKIRDALRLQQETQGTLMSVRQYSDQHWLYVALS